VRIALLFLIAIVALPLAAQEKPRVFITPAAVRRTEGYKSPSYSERSTSVEDRTIEMSRDFTDSCKEVTVTAERRRAGYIVRLNRKTARDQIAVYRTNGDLVGVAEKSSMGGAVKSACELIKKDQAAVKIEGKADPSSSPK
jgi:hypothetical protein